MENEEKPKTVDRSKLTELYPTPKTYDEKLAERAEIKQIIAKRHTSHPKLLIIAIVIALIIGFFVWATIVPSMMFSAPLVGVPLAMFGFLAWVYGLVAGIKKIRSVIDTNPNI